MEMMDILNGTGIFWALLGAALAVGLASMG